MQPDNVLHEIKGNLHRLTVNKKVSRWEPENVPAKVKIKLDGKELTFFATSDLKSGLPEIFLAVSIYGKTVIYDNASKKNTEFRTLDDL